MTLGPEEGSVQFCFSCMREVQFPHQCPNIFGQATTHNFKPCEEHDWHEKGTWAKCDACTWHIEISEMANVSACPNATTTDVYKDYIPSKSDVEKGVECPTCHGMMKKLFTSKDGKSSRYRCPKCHPLK